MPKAKVNTLFSYFQKTPAKSQAGSESGNDEVNQNGKRKEEKKVLTPKSQKSSPSGKEDDVKYKEGDLVWAKLEGYPWWPSLVCNDASSGFCCKKTKTVQVHVQFFDDPPTHAWVKAKFVKIYTGSNTNDFQQRGGQFYTSDPACCQGAEEADKALKLPVGERLKLVVKQTNTEDESDMEVAELMEFDDDIFDNEADSHDDSKENHDTKEEDKREKKKSRSPKKRTKSEKRPPPKRRRIQESFSDNDESGDEYKPESSSESSEGGSSGEDEDAISEQESASEPDTPVKKPQKRKKGSAVNGTPKPSGKTKDSMKEFSTPSFGSSATPNRSFTPSVSSKTKSKLASFSAPDMASNSSAACEESHSFPHLFLEFLKPEKIKDGKRRSPQDPEYDSRTLYVPDTFLTKQTPAMRQWWEIKSKHFDTVLFFKMGKFYELFHMDAVVAVNELGMIYMKGDHAHAGFPEIAYSRYADQLIQKGYRVARIEQTETPEMMQERVKNMSKSTKFDKVVKREVCRITTKGTKVYSFIDGDTTDSQHAYLLALCEKETGESCGSMYGICFVDTSIGKFHLGQFEDDRHCSRLRTLISHYPPVQVLYEKGRLTDKTQHILNTNLASALKDALHSGSEFWDSSKTLKILSEGAYFIEESSKEFKWPEVLRGFISDSDSLGQTAAEGKELAVRSLGALTWYLTDCCLEQELLSMANFEEYTPLDTAARDGAPSTPSAPSSLNRHMILDGVTLANLEILVNASSGTADATLLQRIDQCCTPFGKRLLKQWLCAPLCSPAGINDRLDAVEDLMAVQDVATEVAEVLKKLPDLERLLSKIHTLGSANRSKNHPDSRAVFFEDVTYSKRKIEDFLAALGGFKEAKKVCKLMKNPAKDFKSTTLQQGVMLEQDQGRFPDLTEELEFFEKAFDHQKAKQAGVITPSKGVDKDYDTAMEDISRIDNDLKEYLQAQKKRLGCKSITYWGSGKNRFQMEVPEKTSVPDSYELMSSKKGTKRYRTQEIEDMLADLVDAEERRDAALKDIMRRIFYQFDNRYKKWQSAVECLAVLDVLMSLSQCSRCGEGNMCRPQVVPCEDSQPFLEIREARHPCVTRTFTGGDFIPNDTVIGIKDENDMEEEAGANNAASSVVLVTGPNMGGKSTLMRQVGLVVVMAQMGCYVPAEVCRLTPVDRVFTRLGASDRIMAGESTFFVELSETASILQHATKHSLVLVDELGRGTATFDGTAIACSVVKELSENIRCRTLFSTHYHSLVEEFSHDPNVRLGHMACMVENEDAEDPSQETITFLYKFIKGACPKSYGFNAARLAHLPEEVIQVAIQRAKEFERSMEQLKQFREFNKLQSKQALLKMQQLVEVTQ